MGTTKKRKSLQKDGSDVKTKQKKLDPNQKTLNFQVLSSEKETERTAVKAVTSSDNPKVLMKNGLSRDVVNGHITPTKKCVVTLDTLSPIQISSASNSPAKAKLLLKGDSPVSGNKRTGKTVTTPGKKSVEKKLLHSAAKGKSLSPKTKRKLVLVKQGKSEGDVGAKGKKRSPRKECVKKSSHEDVKSKSSSPKKKRKLVLVKKRESGGSNVGAKAKKKLPRKELRLEEKISKPVTEDGSDFVRVEKGKGNKASAGPGEKRDLTSQGKKNKEKTGETFQVSPMVDPYVAAVAPAFERMRTP